jgi:formiminoglutamase
MASFLRAMTAEALRALTPLREGERRLGETIRTLPAGAGLAEGLRALPEAGFVLLLIPEDIGVRANFGRAGAAALAMATIRRLVAMQDNPALRGACMVLVGEVEVQDLMQQAVRLDPSRPAELESLRRLVAEVDLRVREVVATIVRAGRTAVVIGGGHENAFGVLAGVRDATGEAAACVNIDAHADLRSDAGRHSGNPFSKALEAGHLSRYAAIGLHETYLNEHMWNALHGDARLAATTLEALLRGACSIDEACARAESHAGGRAVTLEVDLDAIAGVPASASTPSGLQAEQVRALVHRLAGRLDVRTLHVCEGIPGDGDPHGVGKLAALIACDFMKARMGRGA